MCKENLDEMIEKSIIERKYVKYECPTCHLILATKSAMIQHIKENHTCKCMIKDKVFVGQDTLINFKKKTITNKRGILFNSNDEDSSGNEVDIKYCPFCGKEL